jgi:outer membrane lipoprotein-sorting protein
MVGEANIAGMTKKITMVLNGDNAWANDADNNKTEDAPMEVAVMMQQFMKTLRMAASPTSITGTELQLAHGGEGQIGDSPSVVLRVSQKERPDITLHYDKQSGLPLKAETRIKEPNGGVEANLEFLFSNFKDVGGAKHFATLTLMRDGKQLAEIELSDFKVDQKFEAGTFDKP